MAVIQFALFLGSVYLLATVACKQVEMKKEKLDSENNVNSGESSETDIWANVWIECEKKTSQLISEKSSLNEQFIEAFESLKNLSIQIFEQNASKMYFEDEVKQLPTFVDKKLFESKLLQQYLEIIKKADKDGEGKECVKYFSNVSQGKAEGHDEDRDSNNTFAMLQQVIDEKKLLRKESKNINHAYELAHLQEERRICNESLTALENAIDKVIKNQTTVEESVQQFTKRKDLITKERNATANQYELFQNKLWDIQRINDVMADDLLQYSNDNECYKRVTVEIFTIILRLITW